MPNYNQAPSIKFIGNKMSDEKKWGYAKRSHELETAIMNGLGDRDMAKLKIMLFLTGNAEGFQVAEATICSRCNISESGYKSARKGLIAMGWLHQDAKTNSLIVDYDVIFGKKQWDSDKKCYVQGQTENTPTKGVIENTPILKGQTDNTSILKGYSEKSPMKGYSENTPMETQGYSGNTSILKGQTGNTPQGYSQKSPQGYSQNTHNSISEQDKTNSIRVNTEWCKVNGYMYSPMPVYFRDRKDSSICYKFDPEGGMGPEQKKEEKWIYDF